MCSGLGCSYMAGALGEKLGAGLWAKKKLTQTGSHVLERKKEAGNPRKRQTRKACKRRCYALLSFKMEGTWAQKIDNVGGPCSGYYPGMQRPRGKGENQAQVGFGVGVVCAVLCALAGSFLAVAFPVGSCLFPLAPACPQTMR